MMRISGGTGSGRIVRTLGMACWLCLAGGGAARGAVDASDFDPQPDPPRPDHWWSGDGHARDLAGPDHGAPVGGLRYAPSLVGQAFQFDGKDASVVFGVEAGNFGKGDFTVEFLLRSGTPGGAFLAKRGRCAHDNFWEISDRLFEVDETAGGLHYVSLPTASTLCDRLWHHVAMVRSGSVLSVYRDGERVAARTNQFVTVLDNLNPLVAGDDPCGREFTGLLDEIKLYGQALSERQIAAAARVVDVLQIRGQPVGGTYKTAPSSHTLVVDAYSPSGRAIRHQWFHNGTAIPEATRPSFTVSPVNSRTVGTYTVQVSDGLRTVTSDPAVVWVGPAVLAPRAPTLVTEGAGGASRFQWVIEPAAGQTFAATDVGGIDLEESADLKIWNIVPNAVRLANGRVEIVDPEAFAKRSSYYRIVYRDPALNRDIGGAVALTRLPVALVTAARNHLASFIGPAESRTVEDQAWNDVVLGATARYLYDPGYRGGAEPAFAELKVVDRVGGQGRGYLLVSLTADHPAIVEFSTDGDTKTERAMGEYPGVKPQKFLRFGAGFLAMEDGGGNLLGSLGTMPALPGGAAATERVDREGAYDSEAGGLTTPISSRLHKPFVPVDSYAELRAAFATNPTRLALRQLRTAGLVSRLGQFGLLRNRLALAVGESRDVVPEQRFESVRVDADDDAPSVRVTPLATGGFRVVATRPGTDILRARSVTGSLLSYTVVVSGRGALAGVTLQGGCPDKVISSWTAGLGWSGDQRQYRQLRGPDWCPVVGCGPTALLMLFGWWDFHGVPSAFYHLRDGFGEADDFRFDRDSLKFSDAPQTIPKGATVVVNGIPGYEPSPEEVVARPVLRDLYDLCNTFCASGQGATTPDELFDGATEYIDRAVRNLGSPENEYGEQFLGAVLRVKYTDGYWLGMTDWEGGGVMVADDIKAGRPGIVGLGDTLFDLHYAVAYAYRRVDFYEGCGSDRELVDRQRWFKCNMGWGAKHQPEWHDAESVWLGMTARLWQKKLPQ